MCFPWASACRVNTQLSWDSQEQEFPQLLLLLMRKVPVEALGVPELSLGRKPPNVIQYEITNLSCT